MTDEPFSVPPVKMNYLKPQFMRQYVDDPTGQPPGTVVVDPARHYLYLVQEGGKALRYGVGVGRAGMEWSGTANVAYKREWPNWTPTQNMIARSPETYKKWAGGMEGGSNNPLGARALYLFEGGKDTLYRIHGTNEPWSIGKSMSSGCIYTLLGGTGLNAQPFPSPACINMLVLVNRLSRAPLCERSATVSSRQGTPWRFRSHMLDD